MHVGTEETHVVGELFGISFAWNQDQEWSRSDGGQAGYCVRACPVSDHPPSRQAGKILGPPEIDERGERG